MRNEKFHFHILMQTIELYSLSTHVDIIALCMKTKRIFLKYAVYFDYDKRQGNKFCKVRSFKVRNTLKTKKSRLGLLNSFMTRNDIYNISISSTSFSKYLPINLVIRQHQKLSNLQYKGVLRCVFGTQKRHLTPTAVMIV